MQDESQTNAASPASAEPGRKIRRIGLWITVFAFLLPLVWMGTLRVVTLGNAENSQDALYHAMMAKLGPKVYLAKTFPWTQMSIWRDHFADKELMYHAVLDGIFSVERLFGLAVNPPFHAAAFFFMALALGGCVFAARRLGIRHSYLAAGCLLFALIVPNFTFRFSVLRPHILSIAYLTFASGLLAKGTFRFRLTAIGILSFCFAWSYSNPHFIVIIPLVFALSRVMRDGWRELLLPVVSLGCVMLGLTIHPQFPNSFIVWKVQSWDALIAPMMAGVRLPKPAEMLPPRFGFHSTVFPLYVMGWCVLMMFIRLLERKGWKNLNPNAAAVTVLGRGFTAGIFLAARSVEYAGPFIALAFLLLLEEMTREGLTLPLGRTRWGVTALLAALTLGLSVYSTRYFYEECPQVLVQPLPKMTAFLREHVPAGRAVVNLDWSDFPAFFYNDQDHLWQWGMDPMFSYSIDPRRTMLLTRSRPGFGGDTFPEEINRAFGAKYGVLLWPRVSQAAYLHEHGWKLVKSFTERGKEEGWIYALDERMLHPQPGGFREMEKEPELDTVY